MSKVVNMSDYKPSDDTEHFKMIRRALDSAARYVICIEFDDHSSARFTNMGHDPEGPIAEARLLERFARAIRRDERC